MENDINSLQIISDTLEKTINAQIQSSTAINELSSNYNKIKEDVQTIKSHFTNGFRSELKNHITSESKELRNEIKEIQKDFKKNIYDLYATLSKDIKEKTDKETKNNDQIILLVTETSNSLKDIIEKINSKKFWIKLTISLIISLGTISGAIAGILRIIGQ